ncbi:MAG: hypothetical protein RLZ25_502 [Pseudomonadota bacterium]|jgi:hypothetical protein
MVSHLSNPPILHAAHARSREGACKDFKTTRNASENSGTLKRFERFISPHLSISALPPEDFLDSLIQRNSWLR